MSWLQSHPHSAKFWLPYTNECTREVYKFLSSRYGDSLKKHDDQMARWIISSSSLGAVYEGTIRFRDLEDAIDFRLASPFIRS